MNMWSNTDVKPVKTFLRKWPKTGIFTYFGAQNGLEIGPQIVHISESNSNEHIKQDRCESRGNFLTK